MEGHIDVTKYWSLSLLERMGFMKRNSTTKCKVSIADFEEKKAQFLFDIDVIACPEIFINFLS